MDTSLTRAALGGAMSTVAGGIITKTKTFNSIFDDISGAEAARFYW